MHGVSPDQPAPEVFRALWPGGFAAHGQSPRGPCSGRTMNTCPDGSGVVHRRGATAIDGDGSGAVRLRDPIFRGNQANSHPRGRPAAQSVGTVSRRLESRGSSAHARGFKASPKQGPAVMKKRARRSSSRSRVFRGGGVLVRSIAITPRSLLPRRAHLLKACGRLRCVLARNATCLPGPRLSDNPQTRTNRENGKGDVRTDHGAYHGDHHN